MKRPRQSESASEAKGATAKTAALGARFFLPYPRPVSQYRKGEGFNHETRVWECILYYVLRHEGDATATYAQIAGEIRPDGTETGIRNGRLTAVLRPMTQADIGMILQMQKSDVSRAMKRLVSRGMVKTGGRRRIHLIGRPKSALQTKDLKSKVARSRNFPSLFLPPPGHPEEKSWLAALVQADEQLTADYNGAVRELKRASKEKAVEAFTCIVESFSRKSSEPIPITKRTPESTEKSPGTQKKATPAAAPIDRKVTGSRNLSPSLRSGSRNKTAPKVARSGHPIREERVRGDFSEPPPCGLAGHSPITQQRTSQPASQPGRVSKPAKQKPEEDQEARDLELMFRSERFMNDLNRRFTRRFALPATPEQAAEILTRLQGADCKQLFDLIKKKQHIRSWAGVGPLADDCAATQDAWRGAETTTPQPPRSKSAERAADYERRRNAGKRTAKNKQQRA